MFYYLQYICPNKSPTINEISYPNDEVFTNTSGLITSGRVTATRPNGGSVDFNHPKTETMNLYEKDGRLWYRFSTWNDSPLFVDNNKKKEFAPFTSYTSLIYHFLFRLVAESPNWYEVEINEETRETKYILKNDHSFARTDYDHYIRTEKPYWNVKIDNRSTDLLDAPNGKKIDSYVPEEINEYDIREKKGDWIKVELIEGDKAKEDRTNGWVRWRDGRKILVGCYFNNWKIYLPK
ncbi:MAG TPA: hypothetical protein VF692_03775 [Pyrinomonadaceae bacterium]